MSKLQVSRKAYMFFTCVLLLICQCCRCSRGLFQLLPSSLSGSLPLERADLLRSSAIGASPFSGDRFEQSSGLQRPKSDSFKWPFLSNSILSGLISLQKNEENEKNDNLPTYTRLFDHWTCGCSYVRGLIQLPKHILRYRILQQFLLWCPPSSENSLCHHQVGIPLLDTSNLHLEMNNKVSRCSRWQPQSANFFQL